MKESDISVNNSKTARDSVQDAGPQKLEDPQLARCKFQETKYHGDSMESHKKKKNKCLTMKNWKSSQDKYYPTKGV